MKRAETEAATLTGKQEQFLAAMLECHSVPTAAEKVGISRVTGWRYASDPRFITAYRAGRRRLVEEAIGVLQAGMRAAAGALLRNLKAGVPAVEVRAAVAVLQQGLAGTTLLDHEERLAAVEELLDSLKQPSANGRML